MSQLDRKLKNTLQALIEKGINITRQSQEGDAIYSGNYNLLDDVFKDYIFWRDDIKKFLNSVRLAQDYDVFFEADSVPNMKGGLEYGDIKSKKSLELLKNIRVETKNKLKLLRQLRQSLKTESKTTPPKKSSTNWIEIEGNNNQFKFNLNTGDFVLNKTKGNFPKNTQEYKLMFVLLSSEDYQAEYESIVKGVFGGNKKVSSASRHDLGLILKGLKKAMKILPKEKSINEDIFKNIKEFGYRIIIK